MKKLAIISTHPIQYNAPLFRLLAASKKISVKVFYTWGQSEQGVKYDPGFGKAIEWDIPLLDGYEYSFVKNIAPQPGTHHFKGIINPTLNDELTAWQPSALFVFGWAFYSHLKCIRHFHKKIPVIFRGDSTLLDETPGIKRLLRRVFLKWVYRHIDVALYTGQHNKAYFLAHGLKEEQLIWAPHAIDNNRFAEPREYYQEQARQKRAQLGIAAQELVLLFAGKFEPKKNPFFLLELAKKIDDNRLRILFVGNGTLEAALKKQAITDKRILFLDFCNQSEMPVIYRTGDVLILPSTGPGETWGLAANEAMASGLAVMLSSKTGGAVDLVKTGENGMLFDTGNMESCIRFITHLLHNRQQLFEMKKASQKLIQAFSYEHTVLAIERLLQKI